MVKAGRCRANILQAVKKRAKERGGWWKQAASERTR